MKSGNIVYVGIFFMVLPLFFSCTDFFSTSLASWAARSPDSLIPTVTAGNVDELIANSENNPDMSLAVLKKIEDALKNAGSGEASALQAAALGAAANASGFGSAILNKADDISKIMEDKDNAKGMVVDAIQDMPNLKETSETLTTILPKPGTGEFDAFVEKANPDDLATAAAVLLAAEAKGKENYIDTFDPGAADTESAKLAVELARAASRKYEEDNSTGRLKDILEGLNLV
ncbi:MAG: hypothetical protein LBE14_02805 [Treponema sp.]|nr:hypothetical protein [Treponema sp.]